MSKDKNIFSQQSPYLIELFNQAKSPEKVLCIPIDYAKKTHVALCCNGQGTILKRSFPVQNNPEGVDYLLHIVDNLRRKHALERKHVFFGGEGCGTFADNFVHALVSKNYPVFQVDAHKAKLQRDNLKASTDSLDLLGIAMVLLNRQGQLVRFDDLEHLQNITRHRRQLVQKATALSNQIHALVDQLCPGFLDEKQSGIPPFSEASLWLMSERFSPRQISGRRIKSLVDKLHQFGVHHPSQQAQQLKAFALRLLPPADNRVESLQYILADQSRLLRDYQHALERITRLIAQQLAKTSGALATTIRGTGIVLAAQLTAETLGIPRKIKRLVSYAGIVPFVSQSGGPEQEAQTGPCSRRYNHILKDTVMQLALHMGRHGPEEFAQDYARRERSHQNKDFGIARRYLRTFSHLMREQCVYLPPALRQGATPSEVGAYYVKWWPLLLRKWRRAGALKEAFDPKNPLGSWRVCAQTICHIQLPLNIQVPDADSDA